MKKEIRFTGFGGQGIILSGVLAGQAAAIYDHKHSTMVQAYGPEARGSACSSQVIIDDKRVSYPYLRNLDVLVAMSQEGYDKFVGDVSESSTILCDAGLVDWKEKPAVEKFAAIPATQIAEKLGRTIVANIVMLGFFVAQTGLVSEQAMRESILSTVPKGTEALNMKAFEEGLGYQPQQ